MAKEFEFKNASARNYLIAIALVIITILLTWYGFRWAHLIKENSISSSYLIKQKIISKDINSIDEVVDVLSETPNTYFIFISYTGDEKVYNLEKDLASIIKEYNLDNKMYYLNVTDIKDDDNVYDKINTSLGLTDKKVSQIPTIIYYNNGKVVDIIKRQDNNIMTSGDFRKLLDIHKIEK